MAKLYPPQINGTIPAFYTNRTNGTTNMVVPFSMNKAVSYFEISGFVLKIKTLNGSLITELKSSLFDSVNSKVTFNVGEFVPRFTLGSFYKIQLAYQEKSTNEIGYYSTVGIIKYTSYPTVTISGLQASRRNSHQFDYTGEYSQKSGDATEKLYSSYFALYDEDALIFQTEEKLHNNTNDTERYLCNEQFQFLQSLTLDKVYRLQFVTTSINGIIAASPKYKIVSKKSIDPSITAKLVATLNFDNGYVLLTLDDDSDALINGYFLISRASNVNDWGWEPLQNFALSSLKPEDWSFKDCTIEQGVTYKYSIQQYNSNNIYSNRIETEELTVDFEDAFLFDGERQLRIRFNPKVSSFKTDIQENKTDTIGFQYPYFTRNSIIYYKEFPISGLISYLVDDNELFLDRKKLNLEYVKYKSEIQGEDEEGVPLPRRTEFYQTTHNLTANNFMAERIFKLEVLQWLNNGKPKLFRSPGEGNYLVRLMNVSLSPNDGLSRMLHTFSCTAYEIAPASLNSLIDYNICHGTAEVILARQWITVNAEDFISNLVRNYKGYSETAWEMMPENQKIEAYNDTRDNYPDVIDGEWVPIIQNSVLPEIYVYDMIPGARIRIDGMTIVIGSTGSYRVKNDLNPFSTLEISLKAVEQGLITYSFDAQEANVFSTVEQSMMEDVPCYQSIGINTSKQVFVYNNRHEIVGMETTYNLLEVLSDAKKTITSLVQVKGIKRPIIDAYIDYNYFVNEFAQSETPLTISEQIIQICENYLTSHDSSLLNGIRFIDDKGRIRYVNQKFDEDNIFLYQLRLPREYRESAEDFEIELPDGTSRQYHYIYKDYKPYTFEQYYIDKHSDRFAPYIGFFYDPTLGAVIPATDDLFTMTVGDAIIDLADIDNWCVKNLEPKEIVNITPKEGAIVELSYTQQIAAYEFETMGDNLMKNKELYDNRKMYEKLRGFYLLYKDGRTPDEGFNVDTVAYIEDFLPTFYPEVQQKIPEIEYTMYNMAFKIPLISLTNPDNLETYYNQLQVLKNSVEQAYILYIRKLDEVILQYRKDNGVL